MLKDPEFDIIKQTIDHRHDGHYFSKFLVESPIDGRMIPAIHSLVSKPEFKKSLTHSLVARHGTGMYIGRNFEDFIEDHTSHNVIEMASFDLKSGLYYTSLEVREAYNALYSSDKTSKVITPLSTGKEMPKFSHLADYYGIADDITQVLKYYRNVVTRTDYDVCLHITQHDSKNSGMRWRKGGKYLGKFKQKHEYICDEVGFDSFITFYLYVLTTKENNNG